MHQLNEDAIPHLARAMIFRRSMADHAPGKHMIELRNQVIISPVEPNDMADAKSRARKIMSSRPSDMPADPDDLSLLIDTIAMRYGLTSRGEAWRKIGINPNRGRNLFSRGQNAIDWPIWFTARAYAMG
ncbi:hypothetical protein DL1_08550 [Thioclava dalianensis]|uniref:Uncharacterized protein n=1 Tax=Thioclava dalianensis TaxID=1185766 RepID=A0A074TFA3_9RHOB|nr:hypothetical protein [Thioclava dalianensis]KEP68820.1 hypothetical protein DL1_08550 [Thioclava dalianensis]SFN49826.1 hypothetical protein SAMN05216224_10677 [Thioclava dalianensis]